jgi:S-adenosylmethionine synthetase
VSLLVHTFGTGTIPEDRIAELVRANFDCRPGALIRELNLLRPIYQKTAAYGHFGRNDPDFAWEKTNKVDALKAGAKKFVALGGAPAKSASASAVNGNGKTHKTPKPAKKRGPAAAAAAELEPDAA